MGTCIGQGGSKYVEYRDRLIAQQSREFNAGSAWVMWSGIEPQPGQRVYGWLDAQLAAAEQGHLQKFGYALITPPPAAVPVWLKEVTSRSQMISLMSNLIADTLTHAKGRVYAWNIVCEAGVQNDIFQQVIGPDYIEIAFSAARKADPDAKLCYVDFDNHARSSPRYQHTKQIVDDLKSKRLIDLVGLEGIMWASIPLSYEETIATFQSYGLPVIVTEAAVLLKGIPGTNEQRYQQQADIYSDFVRGAIDSGVCCDFYFESSIDKLSNWETSVGALGSGVASDQDSSLFDDDMMPKPAYYSVSAVLQQQVTTRMRYGAPVPMIASDR